MFTKKAEQPYSHATMIIAAEQYIIFNDENLDSRLQFIDLVENLSPLEIELPEKIGVNTPFVT